jgi:hypothetical protein
MVGDIVTEREGRMEPRHQHPEDQGWQALVGTWVIEATHPAFPGTDIHGQSTFEWLAEQRFLIQRSRFDHPEIPDAVAVTGIIDGNTSMHYFDARGVHRVFAADVSVDSWRYGNDVPGFSQRFTGTFSDDGNTINGEGELSRDNGATWNSDLAITYRRAG